MILNWCRFNFTLSTISWNIRVQMEVCPVKKVNRNKGIFSSFFPRFRTLFLLRFRVKYMPFFSGSLNPCYIRSLSAYILTVEPSSSYMYDLNSVSLISNVTPPAKKKSLQTPKLFKVSVDLGEEKSSTKIY